MTTLSPSIHAALQIIYDAYDRVYAIASHRWHETAYYDHDLKQSNLLGHYVRTLSQFEDHAPTHITDDQFQEYSQPLADAINTVLEAMHQTPTLRSQYQISNICRSPTVFFMQKTTYARCMSVFRVIELAYPRATYRDGAKSKKQRHTKKHPQLTAHNSQAYHRPQPTVRWTPYKD